MPEAELPFLTLTHGEGSFQKAKREVNSPNTLSAPKTRLGEEQRQRQARWEPPAAADGSTVVTVFRSVQVLVFT